MYPVLRVMENHERAIFILFLLMFFISIYLVGEALTKFLWRECWDLLWQNDSGWIDTGCLPINADHILANFEMSLFGWRM